MSSLPVPSSRIRHLAKLLRASRLDAGLTQQEVAEAIEMQSGVYGYIERGRMIPAEATLQRICRVLRQDYQSVVDRAMRGDAPPEGQEQSRERS